MNIQKQLREVMAGQMSTLGGEDLSIKSQTVQAVWGETDKRREIEGGSRLERDVTVQFPTSDKLSLRVGMTVTGRSQKWKVDNIRKGQAMTTMILIEPNRIQTTL
jgi:hypothetical protein